MFKGGAKFESGTGRPSFTAPFAEEHLRDIRDTSYSGQNGNRLRRCGAHQGHVFPDGPRRPGSFFA
nr:peptide-methionine (R)-S-oxide reductase [Mesorhizobium sp.]